MTRRGTSSGSSSLYLRYLPHDRQSEKWVWSSEGRGQKREGGARCLDGVDFTVPPASFQGNRDESTNVDMTLVQRDAQVSVMTRPGFLNQGCPHFLPSQRGALGRKEQWTQRGLQVLQVSAVCCPLSPV